MAEIQKDTQTASVVQESPAKNSNPWKISTVIFLVLSIVLVVMLVKGGGLSGNVISGEDAGTQIVDALNSRVGGGITYVSTAEEAGFYKVTVSYQGSQIPVYVTKDGKYYTVQLTPLIGGAVQTNNAASQQQVQEVPKSNKPVAEAFVFSYCPYGLQFEKAMMPIYKILKDKADMNLVFIGAMHGDHEKIESYRQLCIEKSYGKDKLWQYLESFMGSTAIGDCNSNTQCSLPLVNDIMKKAEIDQVKIESCMQTDAEKMYNDDMARASSLGVGGSPTFVINGVETSVSRSPDAIKNAICSSFNTAPIECSQAVSTEQASPWFGYAANNGDTPNSHPSEGGAQPSC